MGSEGVGKLKKIFEASATAQSFVESRACISARKAWLKPRPSGS